MAMIVLCLSCVSPPKGKLLLMVTKNIKLPAYPKDGYGIIYVIRPSSRYADHSYSTYVNNPDDENSIAGYTKKKQYIYFYLSPGKSRIYSHADTGAWIDVNVKEDKVYFDELFAFSGFVFE